MVKGEKGDWTKEYGNVGEETQHTAIAVSILLRKAHGRKGSILRD